MLQENNDRQTPASRMTGPFRPNWKKYFTLLRIRKQASPYLMILPVFLFVTLVAVYPILDVFRISLQDRSGKFVLFDNFIGVLTDPLFAITFRQTMFFVIVCTIAHLFLGLLVALLLNEPMHPLFRTVARSIIMLPWAIAPVVVGVIWNLFYNPYLSIVPYLIDFIGLQLEWTLLANPKLALIAISIANIWSAMPFYMLMLLAALQAIPEELYDAANVDGAGAFQRFWHVTLPQLRSTLITLAIFDYIGTFILFDLVWSMTKGGPINSTEVLVTYTYRLAFEKFNFGYSAAAAVIMFFIMLISICIVLPLLQNNNDR